MKFIHFLLFLFIFLEKGFMLKTPFIEICSQHIQKVADLNLEVENIDIFCEAGVYSADQTRVSKSFVTFQKIGFVILHP